MPRINLKRYKQQIQTFLNKPFDGLILENGRDETVTIWCETHPETQAQTIVVSWNDSRQVHPSDSLEAQLLLYSRKGFVKQSWNIDGSQTVRIDARYGKAKVVTREQSQLFGRNNDVIHAGNSELLLRTIGLSAKNGKIQAKSAKKLKQINDFIRVIQYLIEKWKKRPGTDQVFRFADLACGNSYLGFAIAWTLKLSSVNFEFTGVDIREDVIERSKSRSHTLGLDRAPFQTDFTCADIFDVELPHTYDLVVALHACDTASDAVLLKALQNQSNAIVLVPCCQNEVFLQLDENQSLLTRHSLYRREFAATLTDSIRARVLEAFGYKVKVLEFTSSLHTAKSLMIRAEKVRSPNTQLWLEVEEQCRTFGVRPTLVERAAGLISGPNLGA